MKLSIVQFVGGGGVSAECAACLLLVAAADSRHRSVTSILSQSDVMLCLQTEAFIGTESLNYFYLEQLQTTQKISNDVSVTETSLVEIL